MKTLVNNQSLMTEPAPDPVTPEQKAEHAEVLAQLLDPSTPLGALFHAGTSGDLSGTTGGLESQK